MIGIEKEPKVKKSDLLNFLANYFRYFILILMIVLDFILFNHYINVIITISLFLIYIAILIFARKEYKKSKEEISDGFQEVKKFLDQLEEKDKKGVDVLINSLEEILKNSTVNNKKMELSILKALETPFTSNTLIVNAKKEFPQILESYILVLNRHLDVEEYELVNYLISRKNENYTFWSVIYSLVLTIWLIIISIVTFFRIYPYISAFVGLYVLLTIILGDIRHTKKMKFRLGYYRYKKNKIFLKFHQKALNLIWNNQGIKIIEDNKNYSIKISKINSRIERYSKAIKPSYEVLSNYQILAILSVIITLLSGFMLNLILMTIENLSKLIQITSFGPFLYILLLYGFFIGPMLKERKASIIYKKLKELEPILQQKLKTLNQMVFVMLYKKNS